METQERLMTALHAAAASCCRRYFYVVCVQLTEEKLGQSEKTMADFDQNFENLSARGDRARQWTEKIVRQTEVVLRPSAGSSKILHIILYYIMTLSLLKRPYLQPPEFLGKSQVKNGFRPNLAGSIVWGR